jgi:cytochrome P450
VNQTDISETVPAEVQEGVDAAVARVDALVAADADLVHGDVVEQVALELPVDVAVELCHQALDYVPDTVRQRLFEAEHADTIAAGAAVRAEQEAVETKAKQRSARAAATRAGTLAAEAAKETAKVRSATCPECFTVRAASGVCACD